MQVRLFLLGRITPNPTHNHLQQLQRDPRTDKDTQRRAESRLTVPILGIRHSFITRWRGELIFQRGCAFDCDVVEDSVLFHAQTEAKSMADHRVKVRCPPRGSRRGAWGGIWS